MLQPVTIVPAAVSSAAPTLKPEKSATAYSRAARAAATRASEPANDPLEQRNELPFDLLRGFHHFRMMQRFGKHAGGRIGDARDPEHFDAHVPRGNGFRHGGHADGVGAESAKGANLGRRFVARAEHGDVDTVLNRHADRLRRFVGDGPQPRRIDVGHIGESQAESIVVRTYQGVLPDQVDRSEEHTSELQSLAYLVCRLLLEKKNKN